MYRSNTAHLQPALFSTVQSLPESQRKWLEESWAGVFYREFFGRIREEPFAVLYSDKPSRPNVPVNVLVGLEVLKAGFGWSDAEIYEAFTFDLRVRYALGYDSLGDDHQPVLRSIYYFRARLVLHYLETGEDLLGEVFRDITDQQLSSLALRTGVQRMDSTQVASNICDMSRLQLGVTLVQRAAGLLPPSERERLAERLAPYLRASAGQYVYRVKGREATRTALQKVGELLLVLREALRESHGEHPTYRILARFLAENYHLQPVAESPAAVLPADTPVLEEPVAPAPPCPEPEDPAAKAPTDLSGAGAGARASASLPEEAGMDAIAAPPPAPAGAVCVRPKENAELSAGSLQSLDDPEASFRRKGNETYKGYVANVTETCDPHNPLQLITDVRVAPNTTEDATLLLAALPALVGKMGLGVLYTDGGYASPAADAALGAAGVTQIPTAIRGRSPRSDRLHLADYTITTDAQGRPQEVVCPGGQRVGVTHSRRGGPMACFPGAGCVGCPHATGDGCRALPRRRTGDRGLYLSVGQVACAQRRQRCQAQREEGKNPRAAVEATVRQVKHPFRAGKLPVRGLYRVQNLLVGAASMVNIRRIACYQRRQTPGRAAGGSADGGRRGEEAGGISLRLRLGYLVHSLLCLWGPPQLARA